MFRGHSVRTVLPATFSRRTTPVLDQASVSSTQAYFSRLTSCATGTRSPAGVAVEYHDFPTIEWTVYFKNTGTRDTPLLTNVQAIDTSFRRGQHGEFTLHYNRGSTAAPNDYEPLATPLRPRVSHRITCSGGRSTNGTMPYFNVVWPGRGVIVVLGWPGQWAAEFSRDDRTGLRVRGGQEGTRFKLLPGEEVRTPLVVLQFWEGTRMRSHNVWRRWMLAYNSPYPGGKPFPPGLMMCTSDFYPGMRSTAADEITYVDAYVNAGIKLDYWWIDAGWYPCEPEGWPRVGTWEPDPARYPRGLKEVADYVHGKGMKLVVWFEPERVHTGTWLAEKHPEWVLGGTRGGLLNLGDPAARRWLTEHVDKLITEHGIDLYRQDFNMDPLSYWRSHDTPDRQGMTEQRHIQGYLAYWDELCRRHADLVIDTCASGGRRNDIETLRRAVPLLRSDYRLEPVGTQGHTYGMAQWIPYFGTGVSDTSDYVVRSHWCPWLGIGREQPRRAGLDWAEYHRMVDQWRQARDYMLGDFYPLTAYSLDRSAFRSFRSAGTVVHRSHVRLSAPGRWQSRQRRVKEPSAGFGRGQDRTVDTLSCHETDAATRLDLSISGTDSQKGQRRAQSKLLLPLFPGRSSAPKLRTWPGDTSIQSR